MSISQKQAEFDANFSENVIEETGKVFVRLGATLNVNVPMFKVDPDQAVLSALKQGKVRIDGDSYIPENETPYRGELELQNEYNLSLPTLHLLVTSADGLPSNAFELMSAIKSLIWDYENPVGNIDCASDRVIETLDKIKALLVQPYDSITTSNTYGVELNSEVFDKEAKDNGYEGWYDLYQAFIELRLLPLLGVNPQNFEEMNVDGGLQVYRLESEDIEFFDCENSIHKQRMTLCLRGKTETGRELVRNAVDFLSETKYYMDHKIDPEYYPNTKPTTIYERKSGLTLVLDGEQLTFEDTTSLNLYLIREKYSKKITDGTPISVFNHTTDDQWIGEVGTWLN